MSKKKSNRVGVVYSTSDDYTYQYSNEEQATLPIDEQKLSVYIDKKGRGGKEVVLIKGFVGTNDDLNLLAKVLKTQCGVGGSAKEGEIVIQGNKRDQVLSILEKLGYNAKRVGG